MFIRVGSLEPLEISDHVGRPTDNNRKVNQKLMEKKKLAKLVEFIFNPFTSVDGDGLRRHVITILQREKK